MKKIRILALLLAAVLLLSCFAGCSKKPGSQDSENGTGTGTETKEKDKNNKDKEKDKGKTESKSPINSKYAYKTEYKDIPLNLNYVNSTAVNGELLYILAEVVDGKTTESYTWVDEEGVSHDESYEYDNYRTGLFYMNLATNEAGELDVFKMPQIPDGWNGSSYVQTLKPGKDGTLWALYSTYCYRYNLPENFDPNTMNDWEYYEYKEEASIVHLATDGAELMRLTPQPPANNENGESFYLNSFLVDDKGYVYASDYTNLYLFSPEGEQLACIASENGGDLVQYSADKIGIVTYEWDSLTETSSRWFIPLDPETRTWGEKIKMPTNVWDFMPGDDVYDMYYQLNGVIFGYNAATDTKEKVIDWMDCDINYYDLNGYSILPDGRVIALQSVWDSTTQTSSTDVIVLTRVDASTLPEKTVLTLACTYLSWDLRQQIIDYNKKSETHRIVVKDYSEYNTDDDYTAGLTKLNTEIMAGSVPDLIAADMEFPIQRYAARGLLADLYPLMDSDPEYPRSAFVSSLLTASETDGKLYRLPLNFQLCTTIALKKVVSDYPVWDINAVKDAMTRLQPGARILSYGTTQMQAVDTCIYRNMNSFVDWKNKKCSFDSPEFVQLLEFCKQFPAEFDWETFEYTQEDDAQYALAHGLQLMVECNLYSFDSYLWNVLGYGDTTFVGYPSVDGSTGSTFMVNSSLSIMDACSDKQAAWNFITTMLTSTLQSRGGLVKTAATAEAVPIDDIMYSGGNFTPLQADLDLAVKYFSTPELYRDADGNTVDWNQDGQPDYMSKGGYSYQDENGEWQYQELYCLEQADIDRILNLINSTTALNEYDSEIQDIIKDDVAAFFNGDRSAQDTASMIQNRVWLYIQEQG